MLSIGLIEDDDAHAELFSLHVSRIEGLDIEVTRYETGEQALKGLGSTKHDLLFVDFMLRGETGDQIIQQVRSVGVGVPVIAITSHSDPYLAAQVTRAGADDYLDKRDLSADKLVELLDRMLAVGMEREQSNDLARLHAVRLATLTDREVEVLDHIMDGKTNKQIAADLHRSIKTIKVHRGRVMEKMGANTPAELAKFVLAARSWRPQ